MEKQLLVQTILSFGLAVILGLFFRLYSALVATPQRWRRVLKQQGIDGPPPTFLLGNILEIKKRGTSTTATGAPTSHNCGAALFSAFDGWRRRYGDIYTFSLGNKPVLFVNKYDVVKEVISCTSLDLGKPSYQAKDLEFLLGNGIVTSNGSFWAYQRKILAPGLFGNKVKGMTNSVQESALILIDSWKGLIDSAEGGKSADIKIDGYLRKFSGDVISRACFGSSYAEGEQLIDKLRALQQVAAKKSFYLGVPGMRYVPTKQNRRAWELQRDLREMILQLVNRKNEAAKSEKNMLHMIVEGAESSNVSPENFVVDNCKNIYLAGYETTAVAASWCLMLLASNLEWQHRLREEVLLVCKGQVPDSGSIRQMKQLSMVINESLRLYPPVPVLSREALNELEFANVRIPKGVGIWILVTALHTDPDIWGSDSYQFKPDRFSNNINGACKHPNLFMPFGVGPRTCLGQNLAMVELKILLAHILSNFSFSISPKYVHAPIADLNLEPGNGIDLVIERLK